MRVDDLRPISLFDGLTDQQLAELARAGTIVPIEPRVELFHEGEHADHWWVLIDGTVELTRRVGREDALVGTMNAPGRWAGGFRAWDEHGVYLATGRGVAPGRVLRVPAEALREMYQTWFPFPEHLIRGLYVTARSIESTARQRESLVALGTLASGLAHEINNPAAAAVRAVGALEEMCAEMMSALGRIARGAVSSAQFAQLEAMRRDIRAVDESVSPLAMADQEDDLSTWLAGHGVHRDWMIAPPLAAAGLDVAWCEQLAGAVPGAALEPGLEWVATTLSVATLLSEVKEATGRISSLVAAVRSYSQMDRASVQRIQVTEGLESTLAVLGARLGEGVDVVRDYGVDVPQIHAYAGELNQVWTNLIDNAADAMRGTGRLRLSTRADGDHVVVEIGDTGAGMTPDVAARAFDAFYTTKQAGEGAGLGLDIARRIVVERHNGTIAIDPRPGETVVRVRLPVAMSGMR